jgi:hypothetical protein
MGFDSGGNREPMLLRGGQVDVDVAPRVDDDGFARPVARDQVRGLGQTGF